MQNTKTDWPSHVAAIKAQQGSTAAYARQHNLARSSLYYWQRKLKSLAPVQTQAEPMGVAPLPVPPASSALLSAPKPSSKFIALRVSTPERVVPPVSTTTPPASPTYAHCTLVLRGGLRLEMAALPDPRWLADLGHCAQGAQ